MEFWTDDSARMWILDDGKVGIGATPGGDGTLTKMFLSGGYLTFAADSTTEAGNSYASIWSGVVDPLGPNNKYAAIYVNDGHGANTVISPHAFKLFDAPENESLPWSHYSYNPVIGKEINVDMATAIRDLESLTGKKYIYEADLPAEMKVDPEEWNQKSIQSRINNAKQRIIDANPVIEISLADTWEEVDEEVEVQVVQPVTRYRMNWDTVELESYATTEKTTVMEKTGKKIRQFRKDVFLDEKTGRFYKTQTIENVELDAATLQNIQSAGLPKYLQDRLPR